MSNCEYVNLPESGFVIFGASGDLSSRKLFPAFYGLFKKKVIKNNFFILGFGRSKYDNNSFRTRIETSIKNYYKGYDDRILLEFLEHCFYIEGNYDNKNDFIKLKLTKDKLDKKFNTNSNIIFNLATPPDIFPNIIINLGITDIIKRQKRPFNRILIEKPFGIDLKSSQYLNKILKKYVNEEQIFRIDHYLGKSTVQNILVFRFANNLFNNFWDKKYIEKVIIKFKEKEGVGNRINYFDNTGLLRDVFQNHILQLISLIFMGKPKVYNAKEIQKNKLKVLSSIIPFNANYLKKQILFGQYEEGIIDNEKVKGYREELNNKENSCTETFIAAKIFLNQKKFSKIPIFIIAGKRMDKTESKIEIYFKKPEKCLFCTGEKAHFHNRIVFNIKPEQGIELDFLVKVPGSKSCLELVKTKFNYNDFFKFESFDDYESVIAECLINDQSIFWSEDALYYSWKIIEPVINKINKCTLNERQDMLKFYKAGTDGPKEKSQIIT